LGFGKLRLLSSIFSFGVISVFSKKSHRYKLAMAKFNGSSGIFSDIRPFYGTGDTDACPGTSERLLFLLFVVRQKNIANSMYIMGWVHLRFTHGTVYTSAIYY
jgi:hypothetical protein